MGNQVTGTGYFTTTDPARVLAALQAADPEAADADSVETALDEIVATDWVDHSEQDGAHTYSLDFSVKWGPWVPRAFTAIAAAGGTGEFTLQGNETKSVYLLRDGIAHDIAVREYHPGHPDPTAQVVALTRAQVRTLLALVAGDNVDGLEEVVKVLADAGTH